MRNDSSFGGKTSEIANPAGEMEISEGKRTERNDEFVLSRTYLQFGFIQLTAFTTYFAVHPMWDGVVMAELRDAGRTADYGKICIGSSIGQIISSFLMGLALHFTTDEKTNLVQYYPCYIIDAFSIFTTAILFSFFSLPKSMRSRSREENRFSGGKVAGSQSTNEKKGAFPGEAELLQSSETDKIPEMRKNDGKDENKERGRVGDKTIEAISIALRDPCILVFLFFCFAGGQLYGAWDTFAFWYLKELGASELNVSLCYTVMVCFEVLGINTIS